MSENNKYVWTNKGKQYSFDLDQLSPEEYTKFMKLKSNKAKERFIAAFQLYNSSYLPNEISLKSVVYPDYDDKTLSDIQLAAAKYNELKKYLSTDVGNETKQMNLKIKEVQDDILKHTNHITRQDMDTLLKFVPDMTVNQFLNYFNNLMNNKDLVVMNRIQKILKNPFDDEVLKTILNESERFDEKLLKTLVDNDLRSAWANILANIKKYKGTNSARRQAYERAKAIIEKRVFKPVIKELKSINYKLTPDEFSEILSSKDLWERFIGPFAEANREAAIKQEIEKWRNEKSPAYVEKRGLRELEEAEKGNTEEDNNNPPPNKSNMVNQVNNNQQNNLNQTLTPDDNPPEITDEDNEEDNNKDREDKLNEKIEEEAKKLDIDISTPSKTRRDVYDEFKQDEIVSDVERKMKEEEAKKKVKELIGKQIDKAFDIVKKDTQANECGVAYEVSSQNWKVIPIGLIHDVDSNKEMKKNNAINEIYDVLKNHPNRIFYLTYLMNNQWTGFINKQNQSINIISPEIRKLIKNVGAGIFDRIRRKMIPSDIPKDIESMKVKLDSMKDLEKNLTMLKNENAKLSKELASLKEAVKALTDKTEKINYSTKYPGNIIKRDFLNDIPQKHNLRHVSNIFKNEKIIRNPDSNNSIETQLRRKMEERRKDIEPDYSDDSDSEADWGGKIKIKQSDSKMPIKFRRFIEEYLKMDESD